MAGIRLRKHQEEQKAAVRRWVGIPARSTVPVGGARGTIVSATGSGKTIMAASCALDSFPSGRILVMVPTLDLVVQTAQAWRAVGHRSPMIAVCSLTGDAVLDALSVRTTTNPIQLALWGGSGPLVVFATYASLVRRPDPEQPLLTGAQRDAARAFLDRLETMDAEELAEHEQQTGRWLPDGVTLDDFRDTAAGQAAAAATVPGPLEAALAGGERLYGQQMAPFDLAIVDEAHMTAGFLGRPWAAIHDNARIPADYRLYLTATPRILAAPRPRRSSTGKGGSDAEPVLATMHSDPDGVYGTWLAELGLSAAIEQGVLAGFQIDVLEIHDPDPVLALSHQGLRGRRLALLQTALLEHAAAHNIKTTMVFHHQVEEAEAFAAKLPETAAQLYATQMSADELQQTDAVIAQKVGPSPIGAEPYDLEPGRHVPPDRVWAQWLCGDHLVAERRETLRQFANGIDATGRRVHRAFLSSVRVIGQGTDITGERGVEAICFADTRGSQVEIVQNIGRALRPRTDGGGKTARVIVPVFLNPGEDPDDMVASDSFRPLVAVLQGLRSHDERLVEQLASHALTRDHARPRPVRLHRDTHGHITNTTAAGGGSTGGSRDGRGGDDGTDAAAESALLHFSSPRSAATIAAFLRTRVYKPESLVWLEGYQALIRWRTDHHVTGLHAVPYDAVTTVGLMTDYPVGRWTHRQRTLHRAGELEPRRRTLLDAPEAGMVWEPGDEAWEAKLALFRSYRAAHGHLAPRQTAAWDDPATGRPAPVGQHLANLRRTGGLGKNPERAERRAEQMAEIDPDWNCPWPLDWQRAHRVTAAIADAEGAAVLPLIEPGVIWDSDDIGQWLTRQQQYDTWSALLPEQQQRLTQLGITPPQTPPALPPAPDNPGPRAAPAGSRHAAFARGLAALTQWVKREGPDRPVPRGHREQITVDGETEPATVALGVWVSNTRARRDKLTPEQRTALKNTGAPWA
ncbi:Helicase associated domain protein [Actinacidiphila alni]|uniref:DEAD/DEAH box helicase n=1 Tax=Actinacidiphila alni TaxID=380248 RepID=UPI0033C69AF3